MLDILSATKTGQQHLLFAKWARKYGEVVRVEAGPFTEYFVNSDSAVKEFPALHILGAWMRVGDERSNGD